MEHHPRAVVPADTPVVDQLYTTDEVAKLLRVSQRTVQVWIRDGMLTAVRYGRLLRIRQADLAAFGEVLPRRIPPVCAADVSPSPAPAGAAQE
jgi:excisionase family DNA binding protein